MPDQARLVVWSWSGCPSHDDALTRLAEALAEIGRQDEPVAVRWIESEADAVAHRFVGSPTFRVDGIDLVPPDDELYGLTCRVYRTPDGRFSPLPARETMVARLRELL